MGKYQRSQISILFWLLSFTLYILAQNSDEPITDLNLGELTKFMKLKSKEVKYFKLHIDKKKGEQDLVVKVQTPDQNSDPDIYISKKNQRPSTYDSSQWVCSTYGKDTCSISHKNITKGDDFYIGVRCFQECKFSVMTSMVDEIELEDGETLDLDFNTLESKIFRFYVPSSQNTKDELNRVSSVTITAAPYLPTTEYMLLSASTKQDVVPNSASRKGVPGWRKGLILRLSDQHKAEWCNDCWITILLDVVDSGKYYISVKTNVGIQQLHALQKIDDVAFFGERNCYKYYIQNEDHDLQLKLVQYSGLVSYSLHPKKLPTDYQSSAFKNVGVQNSVLIASAHAREVNATKAGLYYICVFPHMTSTYSIVVSEISAELPFKYIEDGYDENGEVLGNDIVIYMFKVPPLEYKGEDIKLEFSETTISGTTPQLLAVNCKDYKDHKKCAQNITSEFLSSDKSRFKKAKQVGINQQLVIDHDERECQDSFKGECYYTIVIQGQGAEKEYSQYSIKINIDQQNYQLLQEGIAIHDFVNLGRIRYYSFTLFDDKNVKNVTFKLNTIHGDADLYVSRKHKFPNKHNLYEKSSVKTAGIEDLVYFDDKNLTQTYIVGVHSYQYSTYDLVALVDRGQDNYDNIQLLVEGLQIKGKIHNEKNFDQYKIVVKQLEGYEKQIKITTVPVESSVQIFVNVNKKATKESYIWSTKENHLTISVHDKNFKRDATYFVTVLPNPKAWQYLIDNYYQYIISYTTTDAYQYISQKNPVERIQTKQTVSYFRHFVSESNKDLSLSMTIFQGNPTIYASLDQNKKKPNSTSFDFQTKNQSSLSLKGKSLVLSQYSIQRFDHCKSSTLTEDDPCTLYLSVFCDSDCKYQLRINYENSVPQQLVIGVPQHNVVKDGSYLYYYLTLRESYTKTLYADLSSLSGNADLYVKFIDNPQKNPINKWNMPTRIDSDMSSKTKARDDIIKIKSEDLKDCYRRYEDEESENRECGIVFGVYAPEQKTKAPRDESTDVDQYNTRFNLIVYTDMIQLQSQTPVKGSVEQGEFQYFLFDATCSDCSILMSLSTQDQGDPDLYINYGDSRLPTLLNYDFQSSTYKSEIQNINLDNAFFKNKKIISLKGPYIIGVYGVKRSNFTLSVAQEKYPLSLLQESMKKEVAQQAFEVTYFLWYNLFEEKDFKIQLSVDKGIVDLYVGTYNENDEMQNLVERLPKSKKDTKWIIENIKSTSSLQQKELLILNHERNYCFNCYYIIGVFTQDQDAKYSLSVQVLDADFKNSYVLKIGQTYEGQVDKNQNLMFRFVIQDKSTFTIVQTSKSGTIKSTLQSLPSEDHTYQIGTIDGTSTLSLKPDDQNFQTDQMYYLVVRGVENNNRFSIMIQQEMQIIKLSDGVQTLLAYNDQKDVSKFMVFNLPSTSSGSEITLQINVRSNTTYFYPRLYFKVYNDIDERNLEFPPEALEFYHCNSWDKSYNMMSCQFKLQNIKSRNAGLAINLMDNTNNRVYAPQALAQISVSASSIVQLSEGDFQLGTLQHTDSFIIYQVDETLLKKNWFLQIEFAGCVGQAEMTFIENPKNIQKEANIQVTSKFFNFGKQYYYIALPHDTLYILVKSKQFEGQKVDSSNDVTDFLIRVKHSKTNGLSENQYYLQSDGEIQTEIVSDSEALVSWGKILNSNAKEIKAMKNAEYTLVYSNNERARLDSVCAVRSIVQEQFNISAYKTNETSFKLRHLYDNKYNVNVLAKIEIDGQTDYMPYKLNQIEFKQKGSYIKMIIFVALIFILLGAMATCFVGAKYKKDLQKMKKTQPDTNIYEMTSVTSKYSRQGGYQQPTIPGENIGYDIVNTTMDGTEDSMRV